jgi:hypothetical protein
MEMITQFLVKLSDLLQPYLFETCMAQVATILVIYSGEIDRYFRKLLKPNPFIVRVTGFILLNAFGYGFVTIAGGGVLRKFYEQIGSPVRVPVIFSIFIIIGIVAERKKHI